MLTTGLSEPAREDLCADAVVWASQHGLVYGAGRADLPAALVHAPLAVFPVAYPKASYVKAQAAMPIFNLLIDRISRDSAYLQQTLAPAAEFDDFTANLLRIHQETLSLRETRADKQLTLGLHRSDYMLDELSNTLLQVELNTIASSFGCLSTLMTQLHHYILQRAGCSDQEVQRLPHNQVTADLTSAMAAAVKAFKVNDAVMVMVVQPNDNNSYDQQWLQTVLWEKHRVRTLRCTLTQIAKEAELHESSGRLTIWGRTVAVAYLRAGYAPEHYPTAVEWQGRKMLEQSNAALCPSVAYQLTGAKKIQQDLAAGNTLERFLSADEAKLMRKCFAGLWSLDNLEDPETKKVLKEVREHPERFVLKPQREGGGNNLYGQAILDRLKDPKGLAAFILMQRIRPPINRCLMIREGSSFEVDSLSELGIFGAFLSQGSEVLINKQAGHLVRTKAASSDEGGVAAGFAVLDSPSLQD
ncbi:hypothetical protein WJX74_005284 [Apatococcus lobatus]|uniref:Glutathione synthetase n=2 Tax=Apatococcus TaxID=904362 RepID=A0AAW1T108_9CHLO